MQYAELGLADAGRIFEHRLEHRLQLAGRTADDLKDLGRRSLLLPRLGKFTSQPVELFLHIGGRGTATARGSGLVAVFELRRLTVAHFHSAPFVGCPGLHQHNRCTDASHGALSQRSGSLQRPRNYTTSMPRLRGASTGWRTRVQCAVLRPRMTGLGHSRHSRHPGVSGSPKSGYWANARVYELKTHLS